ncbi:MAG: type II toxin-antitoxin system RelE/ParE family toxin [Gemmataceae bacterium]|nr:type II toxin-antitoxin system RelE/ParE family toxin [Gemmataceae bacterium]
MRRVTRTAAAERDFEEILEWLSEHSPKVAERFPAELDTRCRRLASQPLTGRPRDELQPGLRSIVVGYYVVFFTVTDDEVMIRRIVHSARDVGAVSFGEE